MEKDTYISSSDPSRQDYEDQFYSEEPDSSSRWEGALSDPDLPIADDDGDNFVYEFCTNYEEKLPVYFDENQVNKDKKSKRCSLCSVKFQMLGPKRENCRKCGAAVCKNCSQGRLKLSQTSKKEVIHCFKCEIEVTNFDLIDSYKKFVNEKREERSKIEKLIKEKPNKQKYSKESVDFDIEYEKKEVKINELQTKLKTLKDESKKKDIEITRVNENNQTLKDQIEIAKRRMQELKEQHRKIKAEKDQKDEEFKKLQEEKDELDRAG
ncbi:unnamed protein product [Moneuplotes crassus]|uniref:FYVE-type domain-containing protein n=1 Tax=Euplotes crassus TaxID=5936 RepID=A0AAD1XSB9_EUPCR|nr:unnamed protein product [Moneuplotes crassus]